MNRGFLVGGVIITHYNGQVSADLYRQRLERLGIATYVHYTIEGYPHNVALIDSEDGFGKNDYVPTTRPLVIVTAPGPGSGKMAVCLSQLYNENRRGIEAGYAKYETFPIWNLPLKHHVNLAYEAATADIQDVNMIDPFHLEAYQKVAINYNRDIEIFPVLKRLFEGIYGKSPYQSPTDMGVNMAGYGIVDDDICAEAAKQEIIRRYFTALNQLADGRGSETEVNKIKQLFGQAGISLDNRPVVGAARAKQQEIGTTCAAVQLQDGTIITSHSGDLLGAMSALLLNAIKHLAGIEHDTKLIAQELITPIQNTKLTYLQGNNPRLHTDEVLIALSILSLHDKNCRRALGCLPQLEGCEAHCTVMVSEVDQKIFRKLGIHLTCEPNKK